MRLFQVLYAALGLAIGAGGCSPRSSAAPGRSHVESAQPVAPQSSDAPATVNRDAEAPLAKVERLMAGFGMRFAHSPEDDRVTAIVTEHLAKARKVLPPNYKFVISRRSDGWAVDAFDFDALLKEGRPRGIGAYHIEDRGGRLKLLYIETEI